MDRAKYSNLNRINRCKLGNLPGAKESNRTAMVSINLLRNTESKDVGMRPLVRMLNEMTSTLTSLFVFSPKKNNSMCKYYGHVIRGSWFGPVPKCADCGSKIATSDELRKAQPQASKAKCVGANTARHSISH